MQSRRILSSHDARASWRTDMRRSIGMSEFDTLLRQAINIRSIVKITPEAANVSPAEIVYQKKDDIKWSRI